MSEMSAQFDNPIQQTSAAIICLISNHAVKLGVCFALVYYLFGRKRCMKQFDNLQDSIPKYEKVHRLCPTNVSGPGLVMLAYMSNTRFGDYFINPLLLKVLGIDSFRKLSLFEYGPTFYPVVSDKRLSVDASDIDKIPKKPDITGVLEAQNLEKQGNGFRIKDCKYYTDGYKNGDFTPRDIAEKIIEIIKTKNMQLNSICDYSKDLVLEQADASTQRWKDGCPSSELDGVPAVVKDHIHVKGLTSRNGLAFVNDIKEADTIIVERMKAAGLMIVGVSHMTQMGMAVFGNNPSEHHGTCRNPVNPAYYPGASSSGTAAAICSGLVPVGIGTDGGGSIRIPSAQCGIVGLKPTFGRCPTHGWLKGALKGTVTHCGPMASNTVDLSLLYSTISGPAIGDPYSMLQPKVTLPSSFQNDFKYRIGVDWKWAEMSNPEIYDNFKESLSYLESLGCEIKAVSLSHIPETNTGHLIAISAEGGEGARPIIHTGQNLSPENATILNTALSCITASDYLLSAKLRTKIMEDLGKLFKEVDVLATPTCAQTAEPILASDELVGTWKLKSTMLQMLYVKLGNFTGIPAIAVPNGYDTNDLPTSIMLHGSWYDEDKLIKIAYNLENNFKRQKPKVFYNF